MMLKLNGANYVVEIDSFYSDGKTRFNIQMHTIVFVTFLLVIRILNSVKECGFYSHIKQNHVTVLFKNHL